MDAITKVGSFLTDSFMKLYTSFGAGGVIGFAIIALPILYKLVRLARQLIKF